MDSEVTPNTVNAVRCPKCGLELGDGVAICPKDGTVLFATPEVGDLFEDKYEFIERRGAGAMGVVFKAVQKTLKRSVAIKLLNSYRPSENTVRRFQQEAQTLATLHHPNLVEVYELGVTSHGQLFSVMEFVDGKPLDIVLEEYGRPPLKKALNMLTQICDALIYVHGVGVYHRDLKPSNIMVIDPADDNPKIKLVDFGVAKVLDNPQMKSLTQTGEFFGTPLYMSPEQAKGERIDQRSDLYSFGCVMYELLTGQPPFTGASAIEVIFKHAGDRPKPLNLMIDGQKYSNAMETLVAKLLEKDPNDRYQTAKEVRDELQAIATMEKGWYHVALPGVAPEKQGTVLLSLGISIIALSIVGLIGMIVYGSIFDKATPVNTVIPKEPEHTMPLDQIGDMSEASTSVLKGKHYGSEFLSAYAALRQKNSLDLRAAAPIAFQQLKNRKDQFITELRAYRIDDEGIAALPDFPLHSMDVANSKITDASVKKIASFSGLNRLDMSGISLNVKDCAELSRLTRMEELILSHCSLTDECMKSFAHMRRLNKLCVAKNDITDGGIAYLAGASLPIYELNMNENEVSDRCVASLAKLPDLEILSIAHNKITNASLPHFAAMPKLRYLNLEHTHISDAGLQKFKTRGLLRLMLHGCIYTSEGVRGFKKLNPQCLVLPDEEDTVTAEPSPDSN